MLGAISVTSYLVVADNVCVLRTLQGMAHHSVPAGSRMTRVF